MTYFNSSPPHPCIDFLYVPPPLWSFSPPSGQLLHSPLSIPITFIAILPYPCHPIDSMRCLVSSTILSTSMNPSLVPYILTCERILSYAVSLCVLRNRHRFSDAFSKFDLHQLSSNVLPGCFAVFVFSTLFLAVVSTMILIVSPLFYQ